MVDAAGRRAAFSVMTSPTTQIIPAGPDPSAELSVVVRANSDHASATVRPEGPAGWAIQPKSAVVEFAHSGEHASEFKVLPDGASEGRYLVRAFAASGGRDFHDGYSLVTRPDIGGFFYFQPAIQRTAVVDVKVPAGSEGRLHHGRGRRYSHRLCGKWDWTLHCSPPTTSSTADLQRFGTIVLGIRAYDTRDDVKKNNQRLLDYAHNGGTLMVQYNTDPASSTPATTCPIPRS